MIFLTGIVAVLLLLYFSRRHGGRGKRVDAGKQRPWRRPVIPQNFIGIVGLRPFILQCFNFYSTEVKRLFARANRVHVKAINFKNQEASETMIAV